MRLAVYVDDVYRCDGEVLSAGLSFPIFAAGLASELGSVTMLGRLDPLPGRAHHEMPPDVEFVALPHYADLGRPLTVARGSLVALRQFWRVLGRVDAIWLLGPHPLALAVVVLGLARRRSVILGVRQDTDAYAAARYPDRRTPRLALRWLERVWRALARRLPVVVVGPSIAAHYARSPRMLELTISLVDEGDIAPPRPWPTDGTQAALRILTVGRLDHEKNPLLLADILAALVAAGRDVVLVVCGEGPLAAELAARLCARRVADRAELRGYVPVGSRLFEVYRSCDAFVHVSWTEGVPQVLFEAFAARLPVVATDVGGVGQAAGDAGLLVPPGDAAAVAAALALIIDQPALRERLVEAGLERVRAFSRQRQVGRLAAWLQAQVSADP